MRKALILAALLAAAPLPAARAEPAGLVAWGCAVASTAGLGAAVVINTQSLVNVVSGAVVSPINPLVLYGGLSAIAVSSLCALGYHVVPVVAGPGAPVPAPAAPAPRMNASRVAELAE